VFVLYKQLNRINLPNDIKKIKKSELDELSKEIRHFLLDKISKTGGHLASNLGVVELTLAMHYCFDPTKDKIVWDVGHQAYVHKMLTGRKDEFDSLRQLDGLSGFPKPYESVCDAFAAGHSATSISAAHGMAMARDLLKTDEKVIAVIGDGSITGGLALEGLNNAGRSNTDMIVILNDNQMSISDNVGAISKHLNDLRTDSSYINAKEKIHKVLKKVPLGDKIEKTIETAKDSIKYLFVSGVLFEEMGFKYVGPIDGHDINELINVFEKVKKIKGPVLIHVNTIKGKGYSYAEKNPGKYHGIGKFDVITGKPVKKGGKSYSSVFGDTIVSLAKNDKRITAISAAMVSGTGLDEFERKFPERMFDVAIAEQHAVTFAAGLATKGFIPVFAVYSTFLQRAYDQIIHDVCLQKLHVIFAIDRAGIVGSDGETHQGIYDISYLSHLPDITIMAPSNGSELKSMIKLAVETEGPVAVRYPRDTVPDEEIKEIKIEFGRANIVEDGKEVAIINCGTMMDKCSILYDRLKEDGYKPMLVDARFVKPVDTDMLKAVCEKCDFILTAEDNVKTGGFGEIILNTVNSLGYNDKTVYGFAFEDKFIEQGTREELFERYGLDGKSIYKKAKEILGKV